MARPHSAGYSAYLESDRWRALRVEVIRRAGYRCVACGRGGVLDVHHAYGYRNLGNEQPEELQARSCHDWVHAHSRVLDAGCLGIIFWAVVIAIGLELAWWVISSIATALLRQIGLF